MASERAICATSSEWVSRVRYWSPSWATNTWVFSFSRRNAEVWMMRSRSRANGVRVRLSASG